MALEFNQFLSIRNPHADVVEFTLTEYVRAGSAATVPVPYLSTLCNQMFRVQFRIEANALGLYAIAPCRKQQALDDITHIIEMLQYKIKQEKTNESSQTRCTAIHPRYKVQCVRTGADWCNELYGHICIIGVSPKARYVHWQQSLVLQDLKDTSSRDWSESNSTPLADIQRMAELTKPKGFTVEHRTVTQSQLDTLRKHIK